MTTAPPVSGPPRVNLMPRSEIARRDRDTLVRLWVWIILGAVLVTLLIIAAGVWLTFAAQQRLVAEQARTSTLLAQIESLAEVSQALATESELTAFRAEAMATDLAWTPVLAEITGILPAEATLAGFDFTVGGAPRQEDPTQERGIVGTVSIDSPAPLDIVEIIRSLRGVENVIYADGRSISSHQRPEDGFTYLLTVEFDQTVYSRAYAAEGGDD